MKSIYTQFDSSGLDCNDLIAGYQKQLEPEIDRCSKAALDNAYAFCLLPDDDEMHRAVMALVEQKKGLSPTLLIVIGIGGSNLGTLAIQQAVYGLFYNELKPAVRIYYADTVDADYVTNIMALAREELEQGGRILINVISKSGTTLETVTLFEFFLHLLKTYHPQDYADYLVVTTEKDSLLWQLAMREGWSLLAIPAQVGGRYSVFSAVGLFSLALIGVDIANLLDGARHMVEQCLKKDQTNPAVKAAAWQYALCKEGYAISNMFLFSNALHGLGSWWRQLIGESLGKAHKCDGVPNKDVMVPIVSMGTTDLHSVGQLYLAHIVPIMTTFVCVEKEHDQSSVPKQFDPLVAHAQNRSISSIMKIILKAVKKTYARQQLPYRTILLPMKNAYSIGQFLQQSMFEVVYIAYLMGVNPFDQPAVELYKHETRELLANE